MNLKYYSIVAFSFLRDMAFYALIAVLLHFMYTVSKKHAILVLIIGLTEVVASYSMKWLSKDYVQEFYDKLLKEKINGEETRSSDTRKSE